MSLIVFGLRASVVGSFEILYRTVLTRDGLRWLGGYGGNGLFLREPESCVLDVSTSLLLLVADTFTTVFLVGIAFTYLFPNPFRLSFLAICIMRSCAFCTLLVMLIKSLISELSESRCSSPSVSWIDVRKSDWDWPSYYNEVLIFFVPTRMLLLIAPFKSCFVELDPFITFFNCCLPYVRLLLVRRLV